MADKLTPETNAALSHQGGEYIDCILRLERLIPVARRLERERDALKAALEAIALINPDRNSDEGWNEWGEADCYKQILKLAHAALENTKPGGGE